MKVIENLFDACLEGSIVGHIKDSVEVRDSAEKLDAFLEECTYVPGGQKQKLKDLIIARLYYGEKQGFELGFKCAVSLLTDSDIERTQT